MYTGHQYKIRFAFSFGRKQPNWVELCVTADIFSAIFLLVKSNFICFARNAIFNETEPIINCKMQLL